MDSPKTTTITTATTTISANTTVSLSDSPPVQVTSFLYFFNLIHFNFF
jgi:hypothetical protein